VMWCGVVWGGVVVVWCGVMWSDADGVVMVLVWYGDDGLGVVWCWLSMFGESCSPALRRPAAARSASTAVCDVGHRGGRGRGPGRSRCRWVVHFCRMGLVRLCVRACVLACVALVFWFSLGNT
jgi:hypothetical protein